MDRARALCCRCRVVGYLLRQFGRCGARERQELYARRGITGEQVIDKRYQRCALSRARSSEHARVLVRLVGKDCLLFASWSIRHISCQSYPRCESW